MQSQCLQTHFLVYPSLVLGISWRVQERHEAFGQPKAGLLGSRCQ